VQKKGFLPPLFFVDPSVLGSVGGAFVGFVILQRLPLLAFKNG